MWYRQYQIISVKTSKLYGVFDQYPSYTLFYSNDKIVFIHITTSVLWHEKVYENVHVLSLSLLFAQTVFYFFIT